MVINNVTSVLLIITAAVAIEHEECSSYCCSHLGVSPLYSHSQGSNISSILWKIMTQKGTVRRGSRQSDPKAYIFSPADCQN